MIQHHNFKIDIHQTRYANRRGVISAWCPDCGVEVEIEYRYTHGVDLEKLAEDSEIKLLLRQKAGDLCYGSPEARAENLAVSRQRGIDKEKFETAIIEVDNVLKAHQVNKKLYHEHTFVFDTDYIKFGEPS